MCNVLKTIHWFLFSDNRMLLLNEDDKLTVPSGTNPPFPTSPFFVFHEEELSECRVAEIDEEMATDPHYVLMDLRAMWDVVTPSIHQLSGKASQLLYWDKHNRFCPVCGTKPEQKMRNMKRCPACGYELFPTITTAILCLVRKGDQILLVQALNFRGTFHSLVAGFLDTGETLEECAAREVREETGLKVKNVTYFGNQSWPYPSGLMVGFIADYESGVIRLQEEELKAAAFYSRENLPELPRKSSLARQMIDWWLEQP